MSLWRRWTWGWEQGGGRRHAQRGICERAVEQVESDQIFLRFARSSFVISTAERDLHHSRRKTTQLYAKMESAAALCKDLITLRLHAKTE